MIIKGITLENFMCYYGINEIHLDKGLNILLGENGEGKTKLFEAIEWLFTGRNLNQRSAVSAMKLHEVAINESFTVRVAIEVDQYEERRILYRSFQVTKVEDNDCTIGENHFIGIEENSRGERELVDAERLMDQIFPYAIRKYSMFKGESELNVFENPDALINLIDLFSDARHFQKYAQKAASLLKNANSAVSAETKRDASKQKKYKELEVEITELERKRKGFNVQISETETQINKLEGEIQKASKHVTNAEDLETVNIKIKGIEDEILKNQLTIKDRYTTYLFDESWILSGFEPIFNEFKNKVNKLSESKRKIEKEFYKKQGAREGIIELTQDVLPLDFNIPNKEVMEELLRDEHCKVCNTKAPKGSEQYEFMKARLEAYLEQQKPNSKNEIDPFSNDYCRGLIDMMSVNNDSLRDVRSIRGEITEMFELNRRRKIEIEKLGLLLDQAKDSRLKIVGSSSGGEDRLGNVLKNYNQWQEDLKASNTRSVQLEALLKSIVDQLEQKSNEKEKIDLESVNSFLIKSRDIIRDISDVFRQTKESKFDEFLNILSNKSNEYFADVNQGAFRGKIAFKKHVLDEDSGKIKVEVELLEGDGKKFHNPNQALETSMHISVLFAISKLAEENRAEGYPLILDAPTSSFGETKTGEFLNIISGTKSQIILLLKDFIGTDKSTNTLFIKPDFNKVKRDKAIWLKLKRPFDEENLSTLNTEIINL